MLTFSHLSFDIHLMFSFRISPIGLGLSLFEPIPDPLSPHLYTPMVVRIAFFEALQKTHDPLDSRGEDAKTDQDEQYPLKDRKKEAEDS